MIFVRTAMDLAATAFYEFDIGLDWDFEDTLAVYVYAIWAIHAHRALIDLAITVVVGSITHFVLRDAAFLANAGVAVSGIVAQATNTATTVGAARFVVTFSCASLAASVIAVVTTLADTAN